MEINKSDFKNLYNITKVLTNKEEIMEVLKTYKNNGSQAVAFGTRKKPRDTAPEWFKQFEKQINARLDNLENLVVTEFRKHKWIK